MGNTRTKSVAIEVPGGSRPAGWGGQFARPTGILGQIAGHLMALRNKERSWWVLPLLEISDKDRVLEVGFGSGVDVRRVSEIVAHGFVAGIDHSEVMMQQARRRNAAGIGAGRVELQLGCATRLPYADGAFDKVFSINVAPFWDKPEAAIHQMHRVLRQGGLVAIAVQPRSKGATHRTALETGQMLVKQLSAAGFTQVRLESKKMKPVSVVCALGVR
jgi:ubiquinone/menaquinone biosynthesis C-methylase UbiE